MPPSRKHYNRIRDLVRVHEDRDNPKGSGSERARADKIVHGYLSEVEQDDRGHLPDDRPAQRHFATRSGGQTSIRGLRLI